MTYEQIAKANEIAAEIKGLQTAITKLTGARTLVNNMDNVEFTYKNNQGRYGYHLDCMGAHSDCYYIKESIARHFKTFLDNVFADAQDRLELNKKLLEEL